MRAVAAPDLGPLIAERIRERLAAVGKSPRAASLEAGLSEDTVRTLLRRPTTIPNVFTLMALAPVLGTSLNYLSTVSDSPSEDAPSRAPALATPLSLPIRYRVAAGAWLEFDDSNQLEPDTAPIGPHPRWPARAQFAARIEGDSINLIWPDGCIARCVDAVAVDYEPRSGDLVVIERRRPGLYERSVKELLIRGRGRIEAWPRSTNPRFQSPLVLNDGAEEETEVAIVALALDALLEGGKQ